LVNISYNFEEICPLTNYRILSTLPEILTKQVRLIEDNKLSIREKF
jgi:hypothetical protein